MKNIFTVLAQAPTITEQPCNNLVSRYVSSIEIQGYTGVLQYSRPSEDNGNMLPGLLSYKLWAPDSRSAVRHWHYSVS